MENNVGSPDDVAPLRLLVNMGIILVNEKRGTPLIRPQSPRSRSCSVIFFTAIILQNVLIPLTLMGGFGSQFVVFTSVFMYKKKQNESL